MSIPNIYQFHAPQLTINYSTGELGSIRALEYQDPSQKLEFKSDEIRTVKTELGTLVTVTIHKTIDSGSTSFTLFVPTVNLSQLNTSTNITTEGITTRHRFSVVPRFNQGQTELYSVTQLSGTAKAVPF